MNEQFMAMERDALLSAMSGYSDFGYVYTSFSEKDVRVLNINGALTDFANKEEGERVYEGIRESIEYALEDESVSSILLMVNSVGGKVTGLFELCDFILKAKETKPINCYVQGTCSSAAYAIASSCNRIYASPYSRIGSVGIMSVYAAYADYEAEQNKGLFHIFRSKNAEKKNISPLTEEGAKVRQEGLDFLEDKFYDHIAIGRNIDKEKAIETFGHGLTFNADKALEIQMIDAIKNYDEVMEEITNSSAEEVKGENTVMEDEREEVTTSTAPTATETTPNATQATLNQEELVAQERVQERTRVRELYALRTESNSELIEKAVEDGRTASEIGLELYKLNLKATQGVATIQARANEMSNIETPVGADAEMSAEDKAFEERIAKVNKARGGI